MTFDLTVHMMVDGEESRQQLGMNEILYYS